MAKINSMHYRFFSEKYMLILSLILIIAMGIRLWGMWFGLPYLYHNDEEKEVLRALQLGAGSFNFERIAKGGYYYLLFLEYIIYFLILKLLGIVNSTTDFAKIYFNDPSVFYFIGRTTTAIMGTLNVFLVYLIGKKIYSLKAGLLGALFLACNFLHAQSSHYVTVDIPMTFVVTITIWYAIKIEETGRRIYYNLGAFFASYAIMIKLPAVVTIIPLLVAHFYNIKNEEKWIKKYFSDKNFIIATIIFFMISFLGNPGLFLNFGYLIDFIQTTFFSNDLQTNTEMVNLSRDSVSLWLYYLKALKLSMGLPLLIISVVGLIYGLYKHTKEDIILISFCLFYYLILSISSHPFMFYSRYIIPILPVLALISARLIVELLNLHLDQKNKMLLAGLSLILIVPPIYNTIREDYLISHKDTRTYAKEWIEKNIPENSKILIDGTRTMAAKETAPLLNSRENILRSIEYHKKKANQKAMFLKYLAKNQKGKTFDLVTFGDHEIVKELDYYKREGVEYIIWRPESPNIRKSSNYRHFAEKLKKDHDIKLIKTIEGNKFDKPGPTLEIYQIKMNSGLR